MRPIYMPDLFKAFDCVNKAEIPEGTMQINLGEAVCMHKSALPKVLVFLSIRQGVPAVLSSLDASPMVPY
jgi:hypothetical protein